MIKFFMLLLLGGISYSWGQNLKEQINENMLLLHKSTNDFEAYVQDMSLDEILILFLNNADLSYWDGYRITIDRGKYDSKQKPYLNIGLLVNLSDYVGTWCNISFTQTDDSSIKVIYYPSVGANLNTPEPLPEEESIKNQKDDGQR